MISNGDQVASVEDNPVSLRRRFLSFADCMNYFPEVYFRLTHLLQHDIFTCESDFIIS
jgi:hypothetical protein